VSTGSPSNRRSSSLSLSVPLGLNKHGNNSTGIQAESTVSHNAQDRRNLSRVRSNRNERILLARSRSEEDLVEHGRATNVLRGASLGRNAVPELVFFAETLLNGPLGEEVVDVAAGMAVVAGVDADSLAEELFDEGAEFGGALRELQVCEGVVGGLEGAGQWADEVVIGCVDTLLVDLFLPEVVGDQGLVDTVIGELGVHPGCGAVAVLFSPVALDEG